MTIRKPEFVPNTILPAASVNDISANGAVQISDDNDLNDPLLDNVNVVFNVTTFKMRIRIGAGTGAASWSAEL